MMPQKNVKGSKQGPRMVGPGAVRTRSSGRLSTPSPLHAHPRFTSTAKTNATPVGPPSDSNQSDSDENEVGTGDGLGSPFQRATRTMRGSAVVSVTGLQFPETILGAKTAGNRALLGQHSNEGLGAGANASDEGKLEVAETSGGEPAGGSCGVTATNAGDQGTPELESKDSDAAQRAIDTAALPTSQACLDTLSLGTPIKATRQYALGNKRDREDTDEEGQASPYKEMKRLRMSTPVVDSAREDELQRRLESSSTSSTITTKEDASSADVGEQPSLNAAAPPSDLRDEVEGQSNGATTNIGSLAPIQQASGSGVGDHPNAIGSLVDADTYAAAHRVTMSLIQVDVLSALAKISQNIPPTQEELDWLRLYASYLQATTMDLTGTVALVGTALPPPSASTSFVPFSGFVRSFTGAFGDSAQTGFTMNGAPLAPGQGLPEDYDGAPNSENAKVWKEIAKTPTFSVA